MHTSGSVHTPSPFQPDGAVCIRPSIRTLGEGRIDFHRIRGIDTVVKFNPQHSARAGLATLRMLREAGFGGPGNYRVPAPLGASPDDRSLLLELVRGEEWIGRLTCLDRGVAGDGARRAARWLALLQAAPIAVAVEPPAVDADRVAAWWEEVEESREDLSTAALRAVISRLRERLGAGDVTPVPSHGDFHCKNVLLGSELSTVIDFDHLALREPAHDVGYCIGQWLVMSKLRQGSFGPGARHASAFWKAFHRHDAVTWERVSLHVARTFLQTLAYLLALGASFDTDVWTEAIMTWTSGTTARHLDHLAGE